MALPADVERVLRSLLPGSRPWHGELLAQLPFTTAEAGCACGCPTVDLTVDGDAVAPATSAPDGMIASASGASGGVLLFVGNGYLSLLEAYFYEDPVPEWPEPGTLTLD
ncbi:hypothetical protein [Allokutzneria albata]|uniref:Uncharacterized protein n=1 Tax=Allokutzneria albata TaxID=211114 RepID=A0A1H0A3Q1_ALLAB|nr:hypothetical protein [Allokutzneria albata]SDN27851.1 hypothetical protein SAMN04489726_5848 [Allokutzneria albata]